MKKRWSFDVPVDGFQENEIIPLINVAIIAAGRRAGPSRGKATVPINRDFAGTDHGTCTRGCNVGPGRGCEGGQRQCREKQDHCQQQGTNAFCSFHNDSPL